MIADFNDFCLWGDVVVDEVWQQLPAWYKPSRGPVPGCSDSELIAMALVGECRGWAQETTLLRCWRERPDRFPVVPERSRFNRRRRDLAEVLSTWDHALLTCDTCGMNKDDMSPTYAGYRFPVEIIGHAVWLYFRFALSYRDVEELLAERGVIVTYETIRRWSRKFGQGYANALRRRRPQTGDKWHLDEVLISINGAQHYLWRAVDQDGNVLDILVQSRRNKAAARKFFRKLLKGLRYVPRVLITDKLASYSAAKREVLPSVEHRRHKGLNNRAENSHQPTRERERRMRRFKSPGHAQRFLAAYGPIAAHFRPRRHRLTATAYRQRRDHAFATWREVTGVAAAA